MDLENILTYPSIDTYFTPFTFDVVLNSIYNIKLLLDEIKQEKASYGYALVRPPGHHCNNKCDGFCIVNNVVVAAKYAQSIGYKKVLIIDYDFHHGDGTEELIKNMENIYMVSIHGFGEMIYPGSGGNSQNNNVLNIPLDISIDPESRKYIDDRFYMDMFYKKVLPFIENINPDLILVSNGLDGHQDDPLEGFNITDNTYTTIAYLLKKLNKPVLYISEGGYSSKVYTSVSNKIIEVFNNKLVENIYEINDVNCKKSKYL
jgi:acetoin utilization deacetylase AcuC-like enzyme